MRFIFLLFFLVQLLHGEEKGKILICGVCKNVAHTLPSVMKTMTLCGEAYDDYRIIIYENNSSDDTKKLLKEWKMNNPKVILFSENLNLIDLKSHCPSGIIHREEILAMARNQVLNEAMKKEYNDFDFLLMTDMDFISPWDVSAVVATTSRNEIEWDGVFANGIVGDGIFYDRYAYRSPKQPIGPECLGDWWWKEPRSLSLSIDAEWEPVYSAFNGLAIYKRDSLTGASYSGTVNREVEMAIKQWIDRGKEDGDSFIEKYYSLIEEWPRYFSSSIKNQRNRKALPEAFGLVFDDSPTQMVWYCGKGARLPHICEHIALHASMANRGHGKLFINPGLVSHFYD